MRFAWVGGHAEGIPALVGLLEAGAPIRAVLTLNPEQAAKRRIFADYGPVCRRHGLALHFIGNINEPAAHRILSHLAADIVFVIGWHQFVRPATLKLARIGMIGAHASLLPHNRGSAPVNWALIRGERESGSTLYWLAERSEDARIIDQAPIGITRYDTSATLYQRVAHANREMLLRLLPRLVGGEQPGRPMPPTEEPALRRRRPADGSIDWSSSGRAIYDFIRALTRPYSGAFSMLDGRRWLVWNAVRLPAICVRAAAGMVLGPSVSPVDAACGQVVACGEGAVLLLEVEDEAGRVLRGRVLSEQPWTGKCWQDE